MLSHSMYNEIWQINLMLVCMSAVDVVSVFLHLDHYLFSEIENVDHSI